MGEDYVMQTSIQGVKPKLSPVPVHIKIVVGEKASPEFVQYLNEMKRTQEKLIETVNEMLVVLDDNGIF